MSEWAESYRGSIWQVQTKEMPNGALFEQARRTPGVRLIVISDGAILLNSEYRHELDGGMDIRLPGGKVFDDIDSWIAVRDNPDSLLQAAISAAVEEGHQECGLIIDPQNLRLHAIDINGGKGEWNLYYFVVTEFEVDESGPNFHGTEASEIVGWQFYLAKEALELALGTGESSMSESRSAKHVAAWAARELNYLES